MTVGKLWSQSDINGCKKVLGLFRDMDLLMCLDEVWWGSDCWGKDRFFDRSHARMRYKSPSLHDLKFQKQYIIIEWFICIISIHFYCHAFDPFGLWTLWDLVASGENGISYGHVAQLINCQVCQLSTCVDWHKHEPSFNQAGAGEIAMIDSAFPSFAGDDLQNTMRFWLYNMYIIYHEFSEFMFLQNICNMNVWYTCHLWSLNHCWLSTFPDLGKFAQNEAIQVEDF